MAEGVGKGARVLQPIPGQIIDSSVFEKVIEERGEKRRLAYHSIECFVQKLKDKKKIVVQTFYALHFNHFCEVPGRGYIPAEVGIAEWSIEEGIKRTWHCFIDPGENAIPTGYDSAMKEWRDETHRINYPLPADLEPKNKVVVLYELLSFLKCAPEKTPPPVFTFYNNQNCNSVIDMEIVVEDILQDMCQTASLQVNFRVFPLVKLFYELKNACAEFHNKLGFATVLAAEVELEKDEFQQRTTLACKYHVKMDAVAYCSLSHVRRWVFGVFEHCCEDAGVLMVCSKHKPDNPKIYFVEETTDRFWGRRPPDYVKTSNTTQGKDRITSHSNANSYSNVCKDSSVVNPKAAIRAPQKNTENVGISQKAYSVESAADDDDDEDDEGGWQKVTKGKKKSVTKPAHTSPNSERRRRLSLQDPVKNECKSTPSPVVNERNRPLSPQRCERNYSPHPYEQNHLSSSRNKYDYPQSPEATERKHPPSPVSMRADTKQPRSSNKYGISGRCSENSLDENVNQANDFYINVIEPEEDPDHAASEADSEHATSEASVLHKPQTMSATQYVTQDMLNVAIQQLKLEMSNEVSALKTEIEDFKTEFKSELKKLQDTLKKSTHMWARVNEIKDEEIVKLRKQIKQDIYESSDEDMEKLTSPTSVERTTSAQIPAQGLNTFRTPPPPPPPVPFGRSNYGYHHSFPTERPPRFAGLYPPGPGIWERPPYGASYGGRRAYF